MVDWKQGRWIEVMDDRSGTGVRAIRVERLERGGFLLHTREAKGTFDIWLETEEDVEVSLGDFVLGGTLPTTSTKS